MKNEMRKKNRLVKNLTNLLIYFLIFFVSILYWELVLRSRIASGEGLTVPVLLFIPAEAMFLAALTGFNRKNRVVTFILKLVIT